MRELFEKSLVSWIPFLFACFFTGGCGGKSDSDSGESTGKSITVSGSLADWPGAIGSFAGYGMVLLNIDAMNSLRSTMESTPGFSFSSVPQSARYAAMLLDPEFRFGWILQLSNTDASTSEAKYQVFRFANGGSLGSLSLEGKLLKSSEQSDLAPQKKIAFLDEGGDGIPDGLQGSLTTYATSVSKKGDLDSDGVSDWLDFDQDNDGVPNLIDDDIDNDGIANVYDSDCNQDGKADQEQPWTINPLVSLPKSGFKYMYHEVKKNADGSETISLWPVFGDSTGKVTAVSLVSGTFLEGATYSDGSTFTGAIFDDGTHGDGVAHDGLWSTPIILAAGKVPTQNQLLVFQTTRGGKSYEYLHLVGSLMSGAITPSATVDTAAGQVKAAWSASGAVAVQEAVSFQVLVFDANGRRVYTSSKLSPSAAGEHAIASSLFEAGVQYRLEVRALAPAPRDGFPGSAWRSISVNFNL